MLSKRIIPCLDIKNGRTVKGSNFIDLKDAGDPVELACLYSDQGADELVFLDISATEERRKTLINLVKQIAKKINIPFTVGGGITCLEDAKQVIESGCDKISINSAAVNNPNLIEKIAKEYGSQALVVAIDAKKINDDWLVYINGGKKETNLKLIDWAKQAMNLGAGEILFTSINNDGTKSGFAIEILNLLSNSINIPIIASGGAGTKEHFLNLFKYTNVDAGLAASIFHYKEIEINDLKTYLKKFKIPIR